MDNYFELYELPESFRPDAALVKQQFYALSKTYHPDRFAQADEASQADALRRSALNNEAYKVLSDPQRTMAYVLQLKGIVASDEKYTLAPEFLMEMMDLNELLSDYEAEPGNEDLGKAVRAGLQSQLEALDAGLAPLLDQFAGDATPAGVWAGIKDFYFRKKYLLRIQEKLSTFASR